mmetsp:Transcript_3442/g.5583  ORF Transcript_3442/g.5583 Transcript_3442/m.5583 type:complete len:235 (+) Transcript_3442:262-966(+)
MSRNGGQSPTGHVGRREANRQGSQLRTVAERRSQNDGDHIGRQRGDATRPERERHILLPKRAQIRPRAGSGEEAIPRVEKGGQAPQQGRGADPEGVQQQGLGIRRRLPLGDARPRRRFPAVPQSHPAEAVHDTRRHGQVRGGVGELRQGRGAAGRDERRRFHGGVRRVAEGGAPHPRRGAADGHGLRRGRVRLSRGVQPGPGGRSGARGGEARIASQAAAGDASAEDVEWRGEG